MEEYDYYTNFSFKTLSLKAKPFNKHKIDTIIKQVRSKAYIKLEPYFNPSDKYNNLINNHKWKDVYIQTYQLNKAITLRALLMPYINGGGMRTDFYRIISWAISNAGVKIPLLFISDKKMIDYMFIIEKKGDDRFQELFDKIDGLIHPRTTHLIIDSVLFIDEVYYIHVLKRRVVRWNK